MPEIQPQPGASPNKGLTVALDAGELLLQCGAEVSRVEDTIQRLCRRQGFARVDVFTITSSIVVTARLPRGETFTQTRRIRAHNTNLGKVARVNDLSRRYCAGQMEPEAFAAALDQVRTAPPLSPWVLLALYMVISCSLSVFFGGGWQDGAAAALSGMVLYAMIRMSATLQMNSLLQTMVCSAVTAGTVLLLVRAGLGVHPDKIMIGNIMLLIPGIQLTTSLRDMINGDTISGLLNLSEALLKAISVALGFSLVLFAGGV
ncbi:threonine/serine exporter family protein [uncultured Subdoligranulum sp.]|uniref:threonine/serine exporter family protein n=1 Tax=uncultured Subdoligranulum sp. TaxID=512298 RepID=UPI0025F6E95C|nr:threonine/serine exporter family protein [uncultured Subdoligranulum sp.]